MTALIHPARQMPFEALLAGLKRASAQGFEWRRPAPASSLALYIYTPTCVYEDERHGEVPNLPFEGYEKLDGSLIITFHHGGRWRCATKGAFDSPQAQWAQARLDAADLSGLAPGTTYLFEAVHPENWIVVRYTEPAMVLLAAYDAGGREFGYDEVQATCATLGWRAARRHAFASIADMVSHATTLPRDDEGFVIRFSNGLRLKLKGAESPRPKPGSPRWPPPSQTCRTRNWACPLPACRTTSAHSCFLPQVGWHQGAEPRRPDARRAPDRERPCRLCPVLLHGTHPG